MAASTEGIKISDIRLINPLSLSKYSPSPKFQIVIKCGSEERTSNKSAISKRDLCVTWNGEAFAFADELTDNNIMLTFTIFRVHQFTGNIAIGSCEHRAIDLLRMQNSSASGLCESDIAENCKLTFKIEKSPDVISGVVQQAWAAASLRDRPNLEISDTWSSFLEKFQVFVEIVDGISEISPYAKVAWGILSAIPKTIIAKKNRDDKIEQLGGKLKSIYDYIMDIGRLPELTTTQSRTLSAVVCQTIECAYFIQAYSTEGTVKNVMKGIIGSVDGKIQEFNDKFDSLMQAMKDSVNLETSIVTLRVHEDVGELTGLTLLNDMRYGGTPPIPKKQCLPGTRQTLINDILKCIYDDQSPQILVVSGQAGIGKSTIAHTIAEIFKKQNRLGSMFCFDKGSTDRRSCLFSTISRDLADGDALWRKELVEIIRLNTAIRETEDPETQFNESIIKPSRNVTTIGPVVIVVDALDESGDRNERKGIMNILLSRWTELPKNYHLIVTTRPEQDIESQCRKSNIPCKRMGDVDAEETRRDIRAFVSNRLDSLSSILDSIDGNWRDVLTKHAEGLFQWAHTACEFINPTIERSQFIKKRWNACVSNSSSSLYGLYCQVISSQSEAEDEDFIEDFKIVVGAIITAREPLSIDALQNIFNDIEDIRSLLTPFGSFFVGVHDLSTPVRPVHTSLFDFFVSKKDGEKFNEYYIDTSNQSRMTLGCLKLMNRMLCFNICQLETSYQRNYQVPNFLSRVEKAIPSHLSYSCRFWIFHLQFSSVSGELIREVRRLMDDNLLYYFEVLSLLNVVLQGCVAMKELANWCKDADDNLAEDAMDAQVFGIDFQKVMTLSTPHLYLSALPFTPRDSFVSRKYLERYPGLISLDAGQPVGSSRKIVLTQESAKQIAFSPKGRYMATSTEDTIDVWNYVTGERMFCFKDWRRVYDIVFSPDGELVYCCCGNGDILIWNMTTREMVMEEFKEVEDISIRSFDCAISSNGCFAAWLMKKQALLFDRKSRRIVKRFDEKYRFSMFSPNGEWIALYGREVHLWNTRNQTQHCVMPSYSWEKPALTDSYIAFQKKSDYTIEIRDVRTNTKVIEIQYGKYITGFCLSPDDQYLLVTSHDPGMYSIWSVSTGELISQSYEDEYIECLRFSYDSKLIALRCGMTLHVRQWERFIEKDHPHSNDLAGAHTAWLRGSYLILSISNEARKHLQISDVTTTNTIIFQTQLGDRNVDVYVSPDEENVRVAYFTSRGLCLWSDKEGEIVIDGSIRIVTALAWLGKYLIFGDDESIKIWDLCTRKLSRGPIDLPYELKSLLPVRGSTIRFAVIYGDKAEFRDCESDDGIGVVFSFHPSYPFDAVSATEKHLVCTSKNDVNIYDLTGAGVSPISFSYASDTEWRVSLDGKYMVWIDINRNIQIFDMDTQSLLTDLIAGLCALAEPEELDRPIDNFWLSNDSKCIITESSVGPLDIWDIQSGVTKSVSYPTHPMESIETLILGKRIIVTITGEQCCVWDLDTLGIMSALYNAPSPAANPGIEGYTIRIPASNKSEILDYALMAWKKASIRRNSTVQPYGWCYSPRNELMFWVPDKMRKRFWLPCMAHMPYQNCTKLNFRNFVHGSDWTKCKSGNN